MATLFELTEEWDEWLDTRPQVIRDMAAETPPNKLYRLSPNGERVTLYSYSEEGTVTVNITGEYNLLTFSRQVFGISPSSLEECDLPAEDEMVGEIFNEQETAEFIDAKRAENGLCPLAEDPDFATH